MKEELLWIWFSRLEISNKSKIELINKFGNIEKVWKASIDDLIYLNISNSCIDKLIDLEYRKNLKEEYEFMKKNKIDIVNYIDINYPKKLLNIPDFPITLFYIGNLNLINNNCVAIVGARNATEYGKNVSRQIAYQLANRGINIVSGLAIGIDKNAHLGCLDSKIGKTIAVLGTGVNKEVLYPLENKKVYERIIESGGLIISEYPINTKPVAYHFPARNRIISGLADKLIVVEAGIKSGSLITADFALEQGKDVWAVPRKYLFKTI